MPYAKGPLPWPLCDPISGIHYARRASGGALVCVVCTGCAIAAYSCTSSTRNPAVTIVPCRCKNPITPPQHPRNHQKSRYSRWQQRSFASVQHQLPLTDRNQGRGSPALQFQRRRCPSQSGTSNNRFRLVCSGGTGRHRRVDWRSWPPIISQRTLNAAGGAPT